MCKVRIQHTTRRTPQNWDLAREPWTWECPLKRRNQGERLWNLSTMKAKSSTINRTFPHSKPPTFGAINVSVTTQTNPTRFPKSRDTSTLKQREQSKISAHNKTHTSELRSSPRTIKKERRNRGENTRLNSPHLLRLLIESQRGFAEVGEKIWQPRSSVSCDLWWRCVGCSALYRKRGRCCNGLPFLCLNVWCLFLVGEANHAKFNNTFMSETAHWFNSRVHQTEAVNHRSATISFHPTSAIAPLETWIRKSKTQLEPNSYQNLVRTKVDESRCEGRVRRCLFIQLAYWASLSEESVGPTLLMCFLNSDQFDSSLLPDCWAIMLHPLVFIWWGVAKFVRVFSWTCGETLNFQCFLSFHCPVNFGVGSWTNRLLIRIAKEKGTEWLLCAKKIAFIPSFLTMKGSDEGVVKLCRICQLGNNT